MRQKIGNELIDLPIKKHGKLMKEYFILFMINSLDSFEHRLVMRFSAEAQEIFWAWIEKIFKESKGNNLSESLQTHLLKMPKTIASLTKMLFKQRCVEKNLLSHVKRLYAAADS
ncbi:YfjI family protein [Bartonella raoultii]|uniref:YfjI family protein n=1 Tax=Bartonella raoultii TaxID=1457020 RepID=UPI001FF01F6E|nr:YfjI family protein [Bartonella raoultii]